MARQYCTFSVDQLYFGVAVGHVQEVLKEMAITPVPLSSPEISGLINLRGQIVTAIDLRRRLGLPDRAPGSSAMCLLLRTQDGAVSLIVDRIEEIVGVEEDLIEPPPETLQNAARCFILGAAKLKGQLMLLLDAGKVIDLTEAAPTKV